MYNFPPWLTSAAGVGADADPPVAAVAAASGAGGGSVATVAGVAGPLWTLGAAFAVTWRRHGGGGGGRLEDAAAFAGVVGGGDRERPLGGGRPTRMGAAFASPRFVLHGAVSGAGVAGVATDAGVYSASSASSLMSSLFHQISCCVSRRLSAVLFRSANRICPPSCVSGASKNITFLLSNASCFARTQLRRSWAASLASWRAACTALQARTH